jgi:hypothetical protein
MRANAIVVLEPTRQDAGAIGGAVVRPPVGPFAESGLDEAFGLAVRARRVGSRAAMDYAQSPTRSAKAVGTIGRPVVSQDSPDVNTLGAKPAEGAAQERSGARGALVYR